MQEIPFSGVGQFLPFALEFPAPVQDFLVFCIHLVPVNRVHDKFCPLTFQFFNHSLGGVE